MAVYTTAQGICAVDGKPIPQSDARGRGYKSPKPANERIYDDGGRAAYAYTWEALCKAHYLEAFAEVYPGEPMPEL